MGYRGNNRVEVCFTMVEGRLGSFIALGFVAIGDVMNKVDKETKVLVIQRMKPFNH